MASPSPAEAILRTSLPPFPRRASGGGSGPAPAAGRFLLGLSWLAPRILSALLLGGTFSPPQEGHRSPWCRLRGSEAPESISPNHTLIFLQSGGGLSVDHEDEVLLLRFG